jgi:hypothetical protein
LKQSARIALTISWLEAADSVIRVLDRFEPVEPVILSETKFSECP